MCYFFWNKHHSGNLPHKVAKNFEFTTRTVLAENSLFELQRRHKATKRGRKFRLVRNSFVSSQKPPNKILQNVQITKSFLFSWQENFECRCTLDKNHRIVLTSVSSSLCRFHKLFFILREHVRNLLSWRRRYTIRWENAKAGQLFWGIINYKIERCALKKAHLILLFMPNWTNVDLNCIMKYIFIVKMADLRMNWKSVRKLDLFRSAINEELDDSSIENLKSELPVSNLDVRHKI